jgi:hypothetical protein
MNEMNDEFNFPRVLHRNNFAMALAKKEKEKCSAQVCSFCQQAE